MNNIRKGDTVRFLNAVGGGVVTRIDVQKGMVYVEDEDGFEIPSLMRECVSVPQVNENTNFPLKNFSQKPAAETTAAAQSAVNAAVQSLPVAEIVETDEGDDARIMLAFIPDDPKNLQTCTTTCMLINDSNYFLFYNLIIKRDDCYFPVATGSMDPNVQDELAVIPKEQLNDWEEIRVQVLTYKKAKSYEPQPTIDLQLDLSPLKFYKLHSFIENDYLDEPAWIIDLTENQKKPAMPEIKPEEIKRAMLQKETSHENNKARRPKVQLNPGIIEVDLHIQELTDTTSGMSNADMLEMQLDKFHAVIAENIKKKGQKIVFIHGKGEGVLRSEILKLLKTRYKSFYFQDASFREYGFGATMIVIR